MPTGYHLSVHKKSWKPGKFLPTRKTIGETQIWSRSMIKSSHALLTSPNEILYITCKELVDEGTGA